MSSKLEHVGVLGMRWGHRRGQPIRRQSMLTKSRQSSLDKRELSILQNKRGLRSVHQKKLDAKKKPSFKKQSRGSKI